MDGPPTPDQGYLVAYKNQQGVATEEHHFEELAVPLDFWWTPPSWPVLPAGTTMIFLSEITSRRPLMTTMNKRPAPGFCWVTCEEREAHVAANRLVEPLHSWWPEPPAFEGGYETDAPCPADMRVKLGHADDLKGTLMNGPTADGMYHVHVSKKSKKYYLHGTQLAVPVQTRRHLHQMEALKQAICSLENKVKEDGSQMKSKGDDSQISELQRKESTTTADALTKQKSDCEREIESTNKKFEDAKQSIVSLQFQVTEKDSQIRELKRKESTTADALTKKESECERANERIRRIAQGERLMLSSAGEHDYSSNLPSPADLQQRIESIQDQHFVEWIAEAMGSRGTWLVSQDASDAIEHPRNFVLQVLVETACECHRRVHECISTRRGLLTKIMGDFVGAAHDGRLAEEVEHFKRNSFHKGYKEMFADVCPVSPIDQSKLARDVFDRLTACMFASKKSPDDPTALFVATQAAYENVVKTLLLTFLECEVQQSGPLKFSSEEFANRGAWNPNYHFKETFDPSYEGGRPVEGITPVQVVIPRLFWEKKDGEITSRKFETKASFVIPSA
ncbi:unnamed protein product [Ectocarpus fasciculatus]